jgi:hypothetical protein
MAELMSQKKEIWHCPGLVALSAPHTRLARKDSMIRPGSRLLWVGFGDVKVKW